MALSRRRFLAGAGALVGGSMLAGCGPEALAGLLGGTQMPADWPVVAGPIRHVLNRLSFGPQSDELAHAAAIGIDAWIEEQLAPELIDDRGCELRLQQFDTPYLDISLVNEIRPENLHADLRAATLIRAIYSRRQFYEIMVDFWSDHFSIFLEKERVGELKVIDDREVIRPYALGNFADLLWASMCSPAMLVSLDNQQNRAGKPNENYARELLELHTLGVDAGYSQDDVQAVARCLTGWTVDQDGLFRGTQRFEPADHDDGPKHIFGRIIPGGGGARDVEQLHALLLEHPALPEFLARKLARRLLGQDPAPQLVARAAAAFSAGGLEIKPLLRVLLESPEFAAAPRRFKRPLHLVAGALRQLGAECDGGPAIQATLAAMGQPLFGWSTPDGFPEHDAAWSNNLLPRWRFALELARNGIKGVQIDLEALVAAADATEMERWIGQLGKLLLGGPLPVPAAAQLIAACGRSLDPEPAGLALAGLLSAPHYQWR